MPDNPDGPSIDFNDANLGFGYTPGPDEPSLRERERIASAKPQDVTRVTRYPQRFDWRNHNGQNYVGAIKHQGDCGSCVAFGTIAVVEGTARVLQQNPGLAVNFSEAHLFYCHGRAEGRHCNNGWWPSAALRAFERKGVVDEQCYPYYDYDQNCTGLCADWTTRARKVTSWRRIEPNADMKAWLSTRGPLVACFNVYEDFKPFFRSNPGGVYRYQWGGFLAGHCVCCIGYDDVGRFWIFKNSWSDRWGDGGYFRIGYGSVGIDAEMWAVDAIEGVQPGPPTPPAWYNDVALTGLWTIDIERYAWIYLDGIGWKRLAANSDTVFLQLLGLSISAKTARRRVNAREENGVIAELYVL